jgi:hypothetical protein
MWVISVLILLFILLLYYGIKKENISEKDFQIRNWKSKAKIVRIYEDKDFMGDYIELPQGKFNINWIPSYNNQRPLGKLGSLQFMFHEGYIKLLGFGVKFHESEDCEDEDVLKTDITIRENVPDLLYYFRNSDKKYNRGVGCVEILDKRLN